MAISSPPVNFFKREDFVFMLVFYEWFIEFNDRKNIYYGQFCNYENAFTCDFFYHKEHKLHIESQEVYKRVNFRDFKFNFRAFPWEITLLSYPQLFLPSPAMKKKVLIIYTGGTIGMVRDHKTRTLVPFNFKAITDQIPELKHLNCFISFHSSYRPIDSSNVQPTLWGELAGIIEKKYSSYDGFVILHGTDTMAYTASALSFMLENLGKPVILTGSQLPLGVIRTDAKRNLITSIEIASSKTIVPEVCVYFNSQLYRGNRVEKYTSSKFDAFHSLNYPALAEAGVEMIFDSSAILPKPKKKLKVHYGFDQHVAILKIFPGLTSNVIDALGHAPGLKALIIETFGSGNAPTTPKFLNSLQQLIKKGVIVLNVSQCSGGSVNQTKYETGMGLQNIGVISGGDMTTEAAVTKTMFLLARAKTRREAVALLKQNLAGEISA